MPGKKKKRFIDKKNAVSFHLVHRSQRDPLQADEESSKFVLQEVENLNERAKHKENRLEEQQKYGIYYEDDYDYMQHLRDADATSTWAEQPTVPAKPDRKVHFEVEDASEKSKLQLPLEVFPSEWEEDVGLLNKAAPISGPRLDLDPDIVAAMDEDFDFEDPDNELEDDFMVLAQGEDGDERLQGECDDFFEEDDEEEDEDDEDDDDDDQSGEDFDSDELDDLDEDQRSYASEETKSRFTNYSLTSSVMRRNDGLTLLDDRFEKIYEEYDDMEIGALDQDEIEGYVGDENLVLNQAMDEFEEMTKVRTMKELEKETTDHPRLQGSEGEESDEEDEEKIKLTIEDKKERWDCESILSTYSTLYNHPTTIKEPGKERRKKRESTSAEDTVQQIKLSQKTGMPLNVLPSPGPTKKQQEREEYDETRLPMEIMSRKKGVKESAEEKKQRKQTVKEERKMRRMEKKANKKVFKEEEKRQEKVMLNLKQNLQGVKIL